MMRRIYSLLLIAIPFLSSCTESKRDRNDEYELIKIDNTRIDSVSDISAIVDSISIVLLKEPDGNYMADIFKVGVSADRNYLFFDLQTNKINAFDREGNFIRTVCKAGDGAQDPLNIGDFWVADNGDVQVYDYAQMKIFNYDRQLNFIDSIPANQFNHFSGIQRIPNSSNYVGYANFNMYNRPYKDQLYQVAVLDQDLKVFKTYQHFDPLFRGVSLLTFDQHFTRYKDTLRFYKAYDNHVYNISSTGISRPFKITYVKQPLPDDIYPILKRHLHEFKDRSRRVLTKLPGYFDGYTRFNGYWCENENYIHFSSFTHVNGSGNVFFTILDKHTNQVLFKAKAFIDNDTYKLKLPPFRFMDVLSNELLAIITGKELRTMLFPGSRFDPYVLNSANHIYLVRLKLK